MLLGVLITILIIVCVLLIAVILMQRSEGGALGMGGGGGGFMSSRGAADLLTRTTQWLGFAFFVLCLAITVVTARTQNSGSVVDPNSVGKIDTGLLNKAPAPTEPAPPAQGGGGFQAPAPSLGGAPAAPAQQPVFPAAPAPAAPAPGLPTK